jgi:SulP family sulfate permease
MSFNWKMLKMVRALALRNELDLFPLRNLAKAYTRARSWADFKAGLNGALLAFPQAMAFAAIAGLPIQYGIYGMAIAGIVGGVFSGSPFLSIGATNTTAIMFMGIFSSLFISEADKIVLLPLLLSMTGLFLIIGAFVGVANLIQFVSRSVGTGFITAAAICIILQQFPVAMGIPVTWAKEGNVFLQVWQIVWGMLTMSLPTVLISLMTLLSLLMIRRRSKRLPHVVIVITLMSLVAVGLNHFLIEYTILGWEPVHLFPPIVVSEWHFTIPQISTESVGLLANPALVMAFLIILEGSSIGKYVAARAGKRINLHQEIFSLGMANLGCAILQGMPASGSLTRSQLNWESGARSSMATLIGGAICLGIAFGLGGLTRYVPTAVLAVLVIYNAFTLINRHVIRVIIKSTYSDAAVFFVTFFAALVIRFDFAIIIGTALSIMLYLRKAASPELVEYGHNGEGVFSPFEKKSDRQMISIVHVEGELFFGAAELFRDQMRRVVEDPNLKVVILKLRNAHHLDATSVLSLEELILYMREKDRLLLVSEVRDDAIAIFKNSGLINVIGEGNLFPDDPNNPTIATARALKRATKVIGQAEAGISIFVGTQKKK